MADEDPDAPQQPLQDPPRPKGKPASKVTAQTYEAMWECYRDGDRSRASLERRFGVSAPTARRAIHEGWPDRGFQALKERAKRHDEDKLNEERKAAQDAFRERTDAWYRAGKSFNRVADTAVTFCIAALQQIGNLALVRGDDGRVSLRRLTKWVRRRTVDVDQDGNRTTRYWDEEVPLTVSEAVKLQEQVMKGAAMASAFKRLWPTQTDEERAKEAAPPAGLAALTDAQLAEIAETGQLPEGVSAEDVFGVAVPGVEKQKRKAN